MRATITAIDDRQPVIGRIERLDGNVVDCATMPLPDGATLVTFQDVTDTVNVERALRERNEALETADKLKIDFVHHVSYELRSPLTNIIVFAHFLGDPVTGPLTGKQRNIWAIRFHQRCLAIINNILDLFSPSTPAR
jgi:signal transduction histidine kinase